ncbi:hypothetical protein [Microbacterium sp. 77mftsu3.1]|uniref:hypothetical protein n=1 Tax=Microbacterium sp. 77mftsu3.1 TaxID=1761802 RepID=UPI0003772948|nr:hypothetical protein [Microbacterium sp. 77mftsu3.1]SDG21503.1 hypothetical protein SAMN04488590_0207 [Microbacterium sp. 77mftsu3.1]
MNIQELIKKQRAELAQEKIATVDIVLGGELVTVTAVKLLPDAWQQLVASCPPRTAVPGDSNIGYDQAMLPRLYPAEHLRVQGEPVTSEEWADLWSVLESVHRNNVGTVIWGLNHYAAVKELRELGKAAAGSASSSPAPSASRPAASKAGSPRKSRATTTRKAS